MNWVPVAHAFNAQIPQLVLQIMYMEHVGFETAGPLLWFSVIVALISVVWNVVGVRTNWKAAVGVDGEGCCVEDRDDSLC